MEIRDFLLACRSEFQKDQALILTDEVVKKVFCCHSPNSELAEVFLKVIVLNKLYETHIYNERKLAKHILAVNRNQYLDRFLLSGGVEVVGLIRKGHGIATKKGKEIDYYSFATKFCCWSNPVDYPMYDSFVDTAIRSLIGKEVPVPTFVFAVWTNLKNYAIFKKVIDYLKRALDFSDFTYKDLDEALWVYGKFLEKKLPTPIQDRLEALKKP